MLANGAGSPAFALTPGYMLSPGDRVDTRGGGRLVIGLNDGSLVIVQPETLLVIKDFRAAEFAVFQDHSDASDPVTRVSDATALQHWG